MGGQRRDGLVGTRVAAVCNRHAFFQHQNPHHSECGIGSKSWLPAFGTTETLSTTEGADFEISSSVISVVLSVSVVEKMLVGYHRLTREAWRLQTAATNLRKNQGVSQETAGKLKPLGD